MKTFKGYVKKIDIFIFYLFNDVTRSIVAIRQNNEIAYIAIQLQCKHDGTQLLQSPTSQKQFANLMGGSIMTIIWQSCF